MQTVIEVFSDAGASHPLFFLLVSIVAKGALILAATGLVATLLRNSAASLRHLIWMCGLAAVLLLPVMMFVLPGWSVPIVPVRFADMVSQKSAVNSQAGNPLNTFLAGNHQIASDHPFDTNSWTVTSESGAIVFDSAESHVLKSYSHDVSNETPFSESLVPPKGLAEEALSTGSFAIVVENLSRLPWSAWAILVWLGGAVVLLGRLLIAHLGVFGLVRRAQRVDDDDSQLALEEAAAQLGIREYVRLRQSDWLSVPVSVGLRRPTIVLPADSEKWDAATRRTVLLHELAHVQRRDCLIQFFVEMTRALFWVNPMVWVAAHHMKYERERACDDAVIVSGTTPSSYAQALLDIARSITDRELSGAAVMAMARKSELEGRLLDILDPNPKLRTVNKAAAIISVAVVLSFALPVSVMELAMARDVTDSRSGITESDLSHDSVWVDDSEEDEIVVVWGSGQNKNSTAAQNDNNQAWSYSSEKNWNRNSSGSSLRTYTVTSKDKRAQQLHFDFVDPTAPSTWDEFGSEIDEVDRAIALLSSRIKSLESVLENPVFDHRLDWKGRDLRSSASGRLNSRESDVDEDLQKALKKFHFKFSASDAKLLERKGVDEDLIVSVGRAGLQFCPSEFVSLAEAGVDEDLIDSARRSGYRFSAKELVSLAEAGVDEDVFDMLAKSGVPNASVESIVRMEQNDTCIDCIAELLSVTGNQFDLDEIERLYENGVDAKFLCKMSEEGLLSVGVDRLLDLSRRRRSEP